MGSSKCHFMMTSVDVRDLLVVVVLLVGEVGRGKDAPHRVDQRHHEEQDEQEPAHTNTWQETEQEPGHTNTWQETEKEPAHTNTRQEKE